MYFHLQNLINPIEQDEPDPASGGAPESPDTTDENGMPVDNPSGG